MLPDHAVTVYIAGPVFSGKTTFISTLATHLAPAFYPDDFYSTAFIIEPTMILALYEQPGTRRFDFLWEQVADQMTAFVVLIDSAHIESFCESISIFDTIRAYSDHPCLLVANKQDHPDAWDVESLFYAMRLTTRDDLIPCVGRDIQSVKQVLLTLLERLLITIP